MEGMGAVWGVEGVLGVCWECVLGVLGGWGCAGRGGEGIVEGWYVKVVNGSEVGGWGLRSWEALCLAVLRSWTRWGLGRGGDEG